MGLLDIFRRDDSEEPATETEPVVDDVLLKALLNDEVITREKALTLPAVSGAVDFITNCVAAMPVRLYTITEGKVEEVIGDVRTQLLNGDTRDTLDAFQLKKAMTADYLLGKGGYCYIQKSRNDVTGLFYVDESSIEIMKTVDPIYKSYDILVLGEKYRPYDFIKLLRNTKDGASGTGLVGEVSKVLETAYQTLLYQLGLVKTGGSKKGFLKSVRKLGQDEIDRLKKAWHNLYSNNEENVVVLNNGLEFQEASASSVEMQLNESKRTMQDEINNLFHISSDFDATFKFAVYPILKAFETALNRDLLLEKEKADYFFEFDVKELTKASLQERYAAYKLAKETGFLTINEIRKAENMNYIEGMDVINVGLGSVLYDIDTHKYYTPNTDTTSDPNDDSNGGVPAEENPPVPEDEEPEEADKELEERFNPNHDAKTGRFAVNEKLYHGGESTGGKHYKVYNPYDKRDVQAAHEYREISRSNTDIRLIAKSSGKSDEEIKQIKRHIFYEKHELIDGYQLLAPDYDIAVAWKRLREGRPEKRDLLLLDHELLESQLEKKYNLSLREAHNRANQKFNWEKTIDEELGGKGEKDGLL